MTSPHDGKVTYAGLCDRIFDNCLLSYLALRPLTARPVIGRDDRIRTCDPHTPSVMRYQAALRPDRDAGIRLENQPWQGPSASQVAAAH
jgi:hypothetical protein